MRETVLSIMIAGLETLLLPAIYNWLQKHIKRKWLVYLLMVSIVLLMTMIIGTLVSVIAYHLSKS